MYIINWIVPYIFTLLAVISLIGIGIVIGWTIRDNQAWNKEMRKHDIRKIIKLIRKNYE